MSGPRVTDRVALTADRCAADVLFEFEQNKIVEILLFEFPGGREPGDTAADDHRPFCFPAVGRNLKRSARAQNVAEIC